MSVSLELGVYAGVGAATDKAAAFAAGVENTMEIVAKLDQRQRRCHFHIKY